MPFLGAFQSYFLDLMSLEKNDVRMKESICIYIHIYMCICLEVEHSGALSPDLPKGVKNGPQNFVTLYFVNGMTEMNKALEQYLLLRSL